MTLLDYFSINYFYIHNYFDMIAIAIVWFMDGLNVSSHLSGPLQRLYGVSIYF